MNAPTTKSPVSTEESADTLETERLTLRPLQITDAAWVGRESGRWEVASKLAFVPSPNPALAAEMFILAARANALNRNDLFRAVIDRATGEGAGIVSATVRPDGRREFGYWYAPFVWGKGYATEAGRALLDLAIGAGARSFHAGYFAHNPASRRVLEKLGFSHDGDETPLFCTAALKRLPHKGMVLEIRP
ncbi:MAG: GNAT family N-acetyltransferase [Oceanicaulis sp.]